MCSNVHNFINKFKIPVWFWLPVSVPKKVKSVHGQRFHWTIATPVHTNRPSHEQLMHPSTHFNINNKLDD